MKIAVITAVFGGMETEKPFCQQSVECDRFFITEANTPVPLPNLPPRLQAKYFKLQAHRVWPDYDCYIWIDGNIEVKHPDFVKVMTENLRGIRVQKHHERQTIREEINHILASENPYLKTRYGAQPLREEYEYYLQCGMPENAPLYSCNIFAWADDAHTIAAFNLWHELVTQWSWFDQSAFSYVAWGLSRYSHLQAAQGVNTVNLGPMFNNQYFTLHPHDKWQM